MLSRICRRSFCSAFPQPWLFIGLGNPGDKYKGTRHNVGFDMVDAFAESVGIQMEDVHCKAIFGKGFLNGVPVFLAKPQTYMNLSGESFHDDMDLPCGVLHLHPKGGNHSHNGVMGDTLLDNPKFNVLKELVSIGRPPGQMDPKAFLLQKFNATARERVYSSLLDSTFQIIKVSYGSEYRKSYCCSDKTLVTVAIWSLSARTGTHLSTRNVPPDQMDPKAFLLQKFNATARERVDVALQEGVGALKQLLSKGLTESSRCFNTQQKYKHIRLQTIPT
nr:peptidyl-tRNA hydrolase, mitochondrial [Ipomoea batatas]